MKKKYKTIKIQNPENAFIGLLEMIYPVFWYFYIYVIADLLNKSIKSNDRTQCYLR